MDERHQSKTKLVTIAAIIIIAVLGCVYFVSLQYGSKDIKISFDQSTGKSDSIQTKTVKANKQDTIQKVLENNSYEIDKNKYSYSSDLNAKVADISDITIKKKILGTVSVDGTQINYDSADETVGDMLKSSSIEVSSDDIVSPSTDTTLSSDTGNVSVTRVTKNRVTSDETVPYATNTVENNQLAQGTTQLVTAGVTGTDKVVNDVTYNDGTAVESNEVSRDNVEKPVDEVIEVGTKPSTDKSTSTDSTTDKNETASSDSSTSEPTPTTDKNETASSDSSTSELTPTTDTNTSNNSGTISNTTTKQETVQMDIPYGTKRVDDASINEGEEKVQTAGVNGLKTITQKVTYNGTTEVSRETISEEVTTEPVTEVIAVGTKKASDTTTDTNNSDTTQTTDTNNTDNAQTTDTDQSSQDQDTSTENTDNGLSTYALSVDMSNGGSYGNATESTASTDFDLICAIVAHEGGTSYEGAMAVISCVMNRVDAGNWGGSNALDVLTAPGQFASYLDGYYTQYLGADLPEVQAAVRDCMDGGLRTHPYTSFRSYETDGSVNICGNWFF